MSRNASVGGVTGDHDEEDAYLLARGYDDRRWLWPRLQRMPPPSGADGDGVAVGTEGDGGVADGDQESRQGSSAGP